MMTPDRMREAVMTVGGRMVTEASGTVRFDTVRAIAETGIDLISIGALTHSVTALHPVRGINLTKTSNVHGQCGGL